MKRNEIQLGKTEGRERKEKAHVKAVHIKAQ
jgi:hypothetical protein